MIGSCFVTPRLPEAIFVGRREISAGARTIVVNHALNFFSNYPFERNAFWPVLNVSALHASLESRNIFPSFGRHTRSLLLRFGLSPVKGHPKRGATRSAGLAWMRGALARSVGWRRVGCF